MLLNYRNTFIISAVAIAVSLYFRCCYIDEFAPVLQLNSGKVKGIIQKTEDGQKVHLYQGIRYGKAARFAKPEPADPWTDIYNATYYREACPQLPSSRMFGKIMKGISKTNTISEDCLFLNVWRPAEDSKNNRSVMFWIHGGSFEHGTIFTQAYDGRYIAHRGDVVVVTVNYRLGPFGFLSGGEVPGNLGLQDQILALKWVKENIHYFGGDPKKVTIFGESAGGISVASLVLSPLTKGLFHRAILQSGAQSGFYTSESKSQSLNKTKHLATKLNCPTDKIDDTIRCFRNKTVQEILEASKNAFITNQLFLPVYGDEVMPIKPQEALKTGKFNHDLDLMWGVTADEGSMFALALFPALKSNETVLTTASTKADIVKMMKHYYQNYGEKVASFYVDKLKNPSQDDLRSAIGHVWGDYHLVCPTILFGEHYAKLSPGNHFYAYRLVQPVTFPNITLPSFLKTIHGTDVFYLFMVPQMQSSYDHYKLSLDMIQTWTSFAKTGNPGKINGIVQWEDAFDAQRKVLNSRIMILDPNNYQMKKDFFKEICNVFWEPNIFG